MPVVNGTLTSHGAVADLLAGIHAERRAVLERNGMEVPLRLRIRAQIDTGTSFTAVDGEVLRRLKVKVIDHVEVRTSSPTGQPQVFDQYAVSPGLAEEGIEVHLPEVLVLECGFNPDEGIQALIGQDLLAHCLFVQNGPKKSFSLAF